MEEGELAAERGKRATKKGNYLRHSQRSSCFNLSHPSERLPTRSEVATKQTRVICRTTYPAPGKFYLSSNVRPSSTAMYAFKFSSTFELARLESRDSPQVGSYCMEALDVPDLQAFSD